MKKIIFVGGTVRSGTTLLNLFLANQENALALGEIHGLFQPTKPEHLKEIQRLSQDERWKKIISGGKKNLFHNLFTCYPEIDLFIDSSKDPFWIHYHSTINRKHADIQHVLIFKTIEDLAKSFLKRGNLDKIKKVYINYHRRYFTLISKAKIIPYRNFVTDPNFRKKICEELDLLIVKNRKDIFIREQPNFFGSPSLDKKDTDFSFSYIPTKSSEIISYVDELRDSNPLIQLIEDYLKNNSIETKHTRNISLNNFKYSQTKIFLYQIWEYFRTRYRKLKLYFIN